MRAHKARKHLSLPIDVEDTDAQLSMGPSNPKDTQSYKAAIPDWQGIHLGDCIQVLPTIPAESIDLIFTSPPYADNRKRTYEGIPISKYVEKFLPIADELYRVSKPSGSFVLNIKERVVNGERQTYVIELILALKERGWFWTEEYIWHKKNSPPGFWKNRFRDGWERLLHFTKSKSFAMYQDNVKIPIGDWARKRLKNLSSVDLIRDESRVGSGFGKNVSNWLGREYVNPDNVLHYATESSNRGHSASFPITLPTFFIKLLTDTNDVVLDPFLGSGTTALAALSLNRKYVGIEKSQKYYELAKQAIDKKAAQL